VVVDRREDRLAQLCPLPALQRGKESGPELQSHARLTAEEVLQLHTLLRLVRSG
jgi:hypothetical protein